MKARDPQPTVRVPREALPEQQQENEGHSRKHQVEKRFALEEQAPVHRLLPTRVEEIENLLQMAPSDRQPRQPDMRHALVVILRRIAGNSSYRLRELCRILQLFACQEMAVRILHYHPVARVNDDPALVNQHFGYHMLGHPIAREQEQAAHPKIRGSRKIQESVRGRPAHLQELCVVESGLWIARRKGCGVCGDPPRRSRSHPIQNGLDSFLRRRKVWNNRVGIPVEIPSNGELPDSGINDGKERKGKQQVRAPPDRAKNGMARFRHKPYTNSSVSPCPFGEMHRAYKRSIWWTGSPQPRFRLTLAHPASRCLRSSSSVKTRESTSATWWASCLATIPAWFASSGAIPHCSVTITGVPDATANQAGMVARHEAHHVAEVLSRVLTDEELRRHLEAGCAKVKRNLGWGEPVHQMERLYARCISPKGQGETEELV